MVLSSDVLFYRNSLQLQAVRYKQTLLHNPETTIAITLYPNIPVKYLDTYQLITATVV